MKKYNFVYKTTNTITNKIYVGVHKTDNLNDEYIGSGRLLKQSIMKHGKENFDREIIKFFDSYQAALDYEAEIVNEDFAKDKNTYNLNTGGKQNVILSEESILMMTTKNKIFWTSDESEEVRQRLSDKQKELWSNPTYKANMVSKFNTIERNEKLSTNLKKWIIENPEAHSAKMEKINKNPEKIRKMVVKQTGRPKSDECKANISKAQMGKYVGEKNGNFKGWYHTPYGKFESLKQVSDAIGNSIICVRDRCVVKNGNVVTKKSVITDSKITKEMIGKTWKELGWYFEEKV